jgi:hypothetical protein
MQVGALRPEELALVVDPLPLPEAADQSAGLLERDELLGRRRPVETKRRFVQRLSRAEPDEDSARVHRLERREALGDKGRVVAVQRDRDGRTDRHALGRLRRGAEPDPGLACMAGPPPGLEVVGAGDAVETRALPGHRLLEQLARVILLVHAAQEVAGHAARLPAPPAGQTAAE